jgi:tape measure domain-containing protein
LARSTEDLGLTQKELVDVTETISQAITISGASAESANAALIQLGQGIASGTLRGDELNSVLEQTPRLAEAIADGIGVGIGQLRELGSEGKITSETIITAIQSQQGAVRTEFGQTSATLSQSFTTINNSLTKFVLELDKASKISETLAGVLIQASEAIDELTNEKSQTRANISAIDTLLTDIPLFELSRIFTAASNPNVANIDVNATTDPVTLIFRALNDLFFKESEKSTNLLEQYITTIEKEQETRKQAQQDFNRLTFELEQEFIELDRATAKGLDDILDTIGEKVDDLDILPTRYRAAGYQPRGNKIGDLTQPNFKKFEVDESVLGFADVVAEVDAVINDLNGGFDGLLQILSKTNPELSKTVGSFRNIFSSAVQGDYITATANYFVLLSDVLFDTGNESDKLAQRMQILSEQLRRANEAAGEATTARLANLPQFAEVRESLLKPFEDLYDIIRERTFEPQSLANIADFYQIDLEQAEIQAEIETLDQFFRSIVGGFTSISEEFQRALQMSGITEENISQYQMRIRDIFFGGGNNEIVFEELGRAALAAKDEFQGLSDSLNNSAREARNLNTAEQAVTRLRVNAQEIALRTQLSEAFKLAGGDVFEQRAAYQRFERQLKGLQYGTSGAGGQTASTASSSASADNASGTSATVDTTIDANVSIDKATISAADLFNIPTTNDWINYWSINLLGRADNQDVGPDNVAQQIINNTIRNRRRIYPQFMFIVPRPTEWVSYWSRDLLRYADNSNVGPDNVAQQIIANTMANRKSIKPWMMFSVPLPVDWKTYWSRHLLARADNARTGPDNVAQQVLLNTMANRKEILPSHMFKVPEALDFFFFFGDMVADFRTGLNAAFTNIPSVQLNIVDLLNFNASGISEAINDAVKEAIRDRSYDEAGRRGFRSGRQ